MTAKDRTAGRHAVAAFGVLLRVKYLAGADLNQLAVPKA